MTPIMRLYMTFMEIVKKDQWLPEVKGDGGMKRKSKEEFLWQEN